MGNVLRVLKRDVLRLLKVPPALVVVVALLVLPSVYTWYNVIGFWNPYDNTGDLRVCVVNEDAGASSELTGELHVGDMIVDELHRNTQLGWEFTDRDAAMSKLQAGDCYAVFVIPGDFTENLLALTTGDFKQASLQYYVNEKVGPVSPKITDTGATTLDEAINSTFVSTVSDVAVKAVDQALDDSQVALGNARSAVAKNIDEALGGLRDAQSTLVEVREATEAASAKVTDAHGSLDQAREKATRAGEAFDSVSGRTAQLQADLASFSAAASMSVGQGLANLSQVSSKAHGAADDAVRAAAEAQGAIAGAVAQGQVAVQDSERLVAHLRQLAESLPDDDDRTSGLLETVAALEAQNAQAKAVVDGLGSLNEGTSDVTDAVGAAAGALDAAVQQATGSGQGYADELFGTTVPAVTEALGRLSSASASMSEVVSNQQLLIDQAALALDQLAGTLDAATEALRQTDGLLDGIEQEFAAVRTDVLALGSANVVDQLFGQDGLDAASIAAFMGSPTHVKTEQLYPLNAYGSAMAPLFMNLTFWIGAFMLLVIMKQEVDAEGIRTLTIAQRYLARFALLAVMAVLQAVICCAGVLAIGVQAANAPALFAAAAVASLSYLSIIYALSVTLQHIGKGVCIVLVFAQIPGATGLYPIEMTPSFFQAVYPFLPFTYGIGAMREAICGFYGTQYAHDIGALVAFFALFLLVGVLVRPLMANVNRMVALQVRESDLINGENVETPARPYRFSQIVRALADKREYRDELQRRYDRFMTLRPWLIRASIALGVAVPVTLALVFALTPAEKVTLLTVWLAWLVALFVLLVVEESLRYSFERQMQLGSMTDEGLLGLYASRNSMERPAAVDAAEPGPPADAGKQDRREEGGAHE